MRNGMGIILGLCLLLVSAVPGMAGDLRVATLGTRVFPCDGQWRVAYWTPTALAKIKGTTLWMGAGMGARADFTGALHLWRAGESVAIPLQIEMWDHYAEPTTSNTFRQWFGGDWITVTPDDRIMLSSVCVSYSGPNNAEVTGWLYYTDARMP